jgi:hypothetical protein
MVQIIEHRAETSVDFAVEGEAASSTPQVPSRPASGTAVVHAAQQHTTAQTSQTPSRAFPGALSAARELLRHSPSSTASPGAMNQWRDDVDRLLGMAHSTSTKSRMRSSRRQHEASASVRSPSVRGAQTNDLRAELNRRRAGEDVRVSLERARELRQNIKGRNLDQDFTVVAPQTPMDTWSQAGVPLVGVGCDALADHLHVASWPSKFRPNLPEKYGGTSNPSEFLQVYVTAIAAAGGNTAVMATYFHVALSRPARTWLMNLAPGSIYSWEELCARFVANFASAYQQHGVEAHLHAVRQEPGRLSGRSSPASPRCEVLSLAFPMLPSSRLSAREYVMRKCWRSWPRMTCRLSTLSSLWPTNAPELPRAVRGTRPRRSGLPSQEPSPVTTKRRRTVAIRSRRLPLHVSLPRLGDGASATSAPGHRGATAARAPCIPTLATAPRNVDREIIRLVKRVSERREQPSKDDSSPHHRPSKERVDNNEVTMGERELGYQSPEGDLKDVFTGDSDSGDYFSSCVVTSLLVHGEVVPL